MPRRPSLWQQAGRLLLELLVVFVGVYAAFALSTWQENQRDQARQQQILQTLRSHVAEVDRGVQIAGPRMDSTVFTPFFEQLEAGEMPELRPLSMTTGEVGTGLWEATLQSGGLDVLDASTIELMHTYFGALAYAAESIDEMRSQSHAYLYPNLGRGPGEFYDTSTGVLRPEYGWYPHALRQQRSNFRAIESLGGSVLAHLDSLLGSTPTDSL